MWSDSTEHLLNAGNGPQTSKGQENLCNWGKAKKEERKESGQDLWPWEGAVKRKGLLAGREISWDREEGLGALEESMAGMQRASRRGVLHSQAVPTGIP